MNTETHNCSICRRQDTEIFTPKRDFYITAPVPKAQGSLGKKSQREGPEVVDDYAGTVCYGHQAVTHMNS